MLLEIPNVTLPKVPAGGEENNVIVREWGTPRPPAASSRTGRSAPQLGLIDLERGVEGLRLGLRVLPRDAARGSFARC